MSKTAEAESSPSGSEAFNVPTRDSAHDENSVVSPSSRLESLKNEGLKNLRVNNLLLQNRARKIVSNRQAMRAWK